MNRIIASVFLITLPFFSTAQVDTKFIKPLTLKEALQLAYQNNPSIKAAGLNVQRQQELKGAAVNLPNTRFGFQYGQFDGPDTDNGFSIAQEFDFPTVYAARAKLARENIDAAQFNLAATKNVLARQVKFQYLQLAQIKQRIELLRFQDSLYQEFLRAAEVRVRTGETAYLEQVAAETRLKRVQNALANALTQRVTFQRQLQKLLGTEEFIDAADDLLTVSQVQFSDSAIAESNPYLSYLRQQVEVAQAAAKLEKAQILPDFSVGVTSQTLRGFHTVDGNDVYFGPDYRFENVQAGISVPIWFGPQKARIQAAKIQQEIAESEYQAERLQTQVALEAAIGEYIRQQSSLEYFREQAIPQAELLVEFAERSFKAGEIDYIEFLTNINEAISIRNAYVDLLYGLNQTIITLDYLTGIQR